MWFMFLCTYAITLWYGSQQIADTLQYGYTDYPRSQTGGSVYSAFFACLNAVFGLSQIVIPLSAVTTARVATKQLLEVINRKPLIDGLSEEGQKLEERPEGLVEFKDVVFAYPSRPDTNVCKGYNLTVAPGQSCALVGASGSGKSTVLNLLLRFYDPQGGTITLDGRNIKDLNTRWLRSQIGYVGQEPALFSGTIADNIAYGLDIISAPELSMISYRDSYPHEEVIKAKEQLHARVIDAAKQANAHEFISSLPDGYETDVGSSGSSLSGGQKQRIAIARALIKKPVVLLLDEATSALDASSELVVQESIDKLQQSKQQTTIIIAHRLNTIRTADKIAVVRKGLIVEEGTHDALMAMDGIYADLFHLQVEGQAFSGELGASPSLDDELKILEKENCGVAGTEERINIDEPTVVAERGRDKDLDKQLKQQVLKRIWAMIKQHYYWFTFGVLGSVMVGAMFPIWGYMIGMSLGAFYQSDPDEIRSSGSKQALYFVALAINSFIGGVLQKYGIAQVGERVIMKLRSDHFQAIIRREISFFDKKENAVGEITTRLANEARVVTKATGETSSVQIQAMACFVIGILVGSISCWKLALVVMGAMIPMVLSNVIKNAAYTGQLDTIMFKKVLKKNDEEEKNLLSTAFTQMRTVTAFSVQFKIAKSYSFTTQKKSEQYKKKAWIIGFAKGMAEFTSISVFALLYYNAGIVLTQQEFTFGDVMKSIESLIFAVFGLGQALAEVSDVNEAIQAANRIFSEIEDGNDSVIDGLSLDGDKPAERARGEIELCDVNFYYQTRPDVVVCKNYNLKIEAGEVVALVGPSGSGKSTIMNLILRFYDPLCGNVKLDGKDVKDLNVRWLRSQIGYVGQEPVLFHGSIADNIARGRSEYGETAVLSIEKVMAAHDVQKSVAGKQMIPSSDDIEMGSRVVDTAAVSEDIIEAAKASAAHNFIMGFPAGYHTDVGESSVMVSGGQKQRIAIARALIKKPAVLLLDEATSALDATSERFVQESIDALQQSKAQTTIVIAHRLTTIKRADKIAVIQNGQVVEVGKHDELLALNGLYAELWFQQVGFTPSTSRQSLSRGLSTTSSMGNIWGDHTTSVRGLAHSESSDHHWF